MGTYVYLNVSRVGARVYRRERQRGAPAGIHRQTGGENL